MTDELKKIEWSAPEYDHHRKNADWFWGLGIVTVAVFIASLLLKNFLFGLFALLAGFSLALYSARKPEMAEFVIDHRGIKINKTLYDFENLKHFWVHYEPQYKKELILESNKTFMHHITIPLANENPVEIREYLLQYLPEEKIEESLIDILGKLLGF